MRWKELLQTYPLRLCGPDKNPEIVDITDDSRRVHPGVLFVCISGTRVDGHAYLREAVDQGAVAVLLSDPDQMPEDLRSQIPWGIVEDARDAFAFCSQAFYGWPARSLRVVACIGGAGRKSVARLGQRLWTRLGLPAGVQYGMHLVLGEEDCLQSRSTPQAREYATGLAAAKQAGIHTVFLPLSTLDLELKRAGWIDPAAVILLGTDSLSPAEEAFLARAPLVILPANHPEQLKRGVERRKKLEGKGLAPTPQLDVQKPQAEREQRRITFLCPPFPVPDSRRDETEIPPPPADLILQTVEPWHESLSTVLTWSYRGIPQPTLTLRTPGAYAAENLMSLIALGLGFEESQDHEEGTGNWIEAVTAVAPTLQIPGHTEPWITPSGLRGVIDSAWRAEDLERLQHRLRPWVQAGGRILLLYGSGGERPREDRIQQGHACVTGNADWVCLTVSHPRSEGGESVVADLRAGVAEALSERGQQNLTVICEPDRRRAIQLLLQEAKPQDLCLLTGKGEEGYLIDKQTLELVTDREILESAGAIFDKKASQSPKHDPLNRNRKADNHR